MKRGSPLVDMLLRALTIPVAGIASFVLTNLVLRQEGVAFFAAISVIWSLTQLLPSSDFGMGASIVNVVAQSADPPQDEQVIRVIAGALRVLIVASIVLLAVGTLSAALGLWSLALPVGKNVHLDVDRSVWVLLVVLAFTMPVSLWQRIGLGLHMNRQIIALTSVTMPFTLALGALVLVLDLPRELLAGVPGIVGLIIAVIGSQVVRKHVSFNVADMLRRALRRNPIGRETVFASGLAMAVIIVVQPLALQSDRLFLGWQLGHLAVAEYSLASLIYMPCLAVLAAGASALWPRFAVHRAQGTEGGREFRGSMLRLGSLSVLAAVGLVLVGPIVLRYVGSGEVEPNVPILASFGLLLVVQSLCMTPSMYFTSREGLRFQAVLIAIMLGVKLSLTALFGGLAPWAPIVASAIAVASCQLGPLLISYRREMRRR